MSYNKNTWTSGDVITAEKLNNMETGIDSNAVTELNALGTALLGDSYTPVEGHNNAQTIQDIANAVTAAGGIGGEKSIDIIMRTTNDPGNPIAADPLEPGLTMKDLINANCVIVANSEDLILSAPNIFAQLGTPVDAGNAARVPEVGESLAITYTASGTSTNYDATVAAGENGAVTIGFVRGVISIAQDGSAIFIASGASGYQGITVVGQTGDDLFENLRANIAMVGLSGSVIMIMVSGYDLGLAYNPETGEVVISES